MISVTPDPIALQIGPFPVYWYGVVLRRRPGGRLRGRPREARRRGLNPGSSATGSSSSRSRRSSAGGSTTSSTSGRCTRTTCSRSSCRRTPASASTAGSSPGTSRRHPVRALQAQPVLRWADIVAPGAVRDAGGRALGQLLQPGAVRPADVPPVGHRRSTAPTASPQYPCAEFPEATTAFHPLFLYESICGDPRRGGADLARRRRRHRLRPGDLLLIFFVWYGVVRFLLEPLRHGNWTFNGIPTAMLVSLASSRWRWSSWPYRHRPGPRTATRWRHAGRGVRWVAPEGAGRRRRVRRATSTTTTSTTTTTDEYETNTTTTTDAPTTRRTSTRGRGCHPADRRTSPNH